MITGFIGLGNLGTPIVQNIIERRGKIHLYNRTEAKMESFKTSAILHNSISSLAKECNLVFSTVSDDKALEAICFGKDGLIENLAPGSIHVCLSTIAPATAARLHEAHKQNNIDYLTATIIGRPEAAKARNLVVCFSGQSSKKEAVLEILKDAGGHKIFEFGDDPQNAAAAKVCTNFLIVSAIESMSESFNLVKQAGVDKKAFYEMITDTIFSSPIYKNYGKIIVEETYHQKGGFTSQLGFKDAKLAVHLAEELSAPLPLGDLIKNRFMINHNRGRIDWDWTSIAEVINEENK